MGWSWPCCNDLDTLDLDIVKMYHYTKNEVSMSNASKVIAQTNKQTYRLTDRHTHTQALRKHNKVN